VSFADAIKVCLSKYVDFTGRARRSEFWWFFLFTVLVSIVASILDAILGTGYGGSSSGGVINTIASLALLLPSIAVAIRRLHDTSRIGWWILIGLIPIVGWIILIVFYCQDSHGDNKYGPSPKGVPAGAGGPPPGPYGEPPSANPPPDPYADPPA
jgi:uncharacterized membrane protein YhaH (DUF805 family)